MLNFFFVVIMVGWLYLLIIYVYLPSYLRNATIIAGDEECHLGIIDGFTYSNVLKVDTLKTRKIEEKFLNEKFFLTKLPYTYFSKRYFSEFIYKEYSKGETLFLETDPLQKLFFIRNGEASVTFYKSLNELDNLVTELSKKCKYDYKKEELSLKCNPILFEKQRNIKQTFKVRDLLYIL